MAEKIFRRASVAVFFLCAFVYGAGTASAAGKVHTPTKPIVSETKEYREPNDDEVYSPSVTWDCVWFGSYPQTKVSEKSALYKILKRSVKWDSKGDGSYKGKKYRRIKASKGKYRYFRYDPIKWRILDVNGSILTLLADKAIEGKSYSKSDEITEEDSWENCTLRSYLNGYTADKNLYGKDYSKNGNSFISRAFTKAEQSAIVTTKTYNNDLAFSTNTGIATEDKVFIPAESDICQSKQALRNGFKAEFLENDSSRRVSATEYAKELIDKRLKTDYGRNDACWALRSTSSKKLNNSYVTIYGRIAMYNFSDWAYPDEYLYDKKKAFKKHSFGIRPMMNIDASVTSGVYYAGTVSACPDGENETARSKKINVGNTEHSEGFIPVSGDTSEIIDACAEGKEYTIDGITYKVSIVEGYWEDDIFGNTKYLLSVTDIPDIPNVDIPMSVTIGTNRCEVIYMSEKAAYEKKKLVSISLPRGMQYIGKEAFSGCSNLEVITSEGEKRLPRSYNSITIEKKAFFNCSSLKELDLTTLDCLIRPTAFDGCISLDLKTEDQRLGLYSESNFQDPCILYTAGEESKRSTIIHPYAFESSFLKGLVKVSWAVPENDVIDYEIDEANNCIRVIAKKAGSVIVTATASGGLSASMNATVEDPHFNLGRNGGTYFDRITVSKGKRFAFYFYKHPVGGTVTMDEQSSASKKIAEAYVRKNAENNDRLYVKGLKKGTTYITLRYYDYVKKLKITVK